MVKQKHEKAEDHLFMLQAGFGLVISRTKVSSAIVLERPRLPRSADFFFITCFWLTPLASQQKSTSNDRYTATWGLIGRSQTVSCKPIQIIESRRSLLSTELGTVTTTQVKKWAPYILLYTNMNLIHLHKTKRCHLMSALHRDRDQDGGAVTLELNYEGLRFKFRPGYQICWRGIH